MLLFSGLISFLLDLRICDTCWKLIIQFLKVPLFSQGFWISLNFIQRTPKNPWRWRWLFGSKSWAILVTFRRAHHHIFKLLIDVLAENWSSRSSLGFVYLISRVHFSVRILIVLILRLPRLELSQLITNPGRRTWARDRFSLHNNFTFQLLVSLIKRNLIEPLLF